MRLGFTAVNLTILNYCNVNCEYPGDSSKNLTERSSVITQAATQTSGDRHIFGYVALLSKLDTASIGSSRNRGLSISSICSVLMALRNNSKWKSLPITVNRTGGGQPPNGAIGTD